MSTKIYHGYKIRPMGIRKLQRLLKTFSFEAEQVVTNLLATHLANRIAEMLDDAKYMTEEAFIVRHVLFDHEYQKYLENKKNKDAAMQNEPLQTKNYPHRTVFQVVDHKTEERYDHVVKTGERDPAIDFDCSVNILTINRKLFGFIPFGTKILATLFTEKRELRDMWSNLKWVSYYGYWNNSDRPSSTSEREWKLRRKDWDEAIPGLSVKHALTFEVVKGYPSLDETVEKVLEHIPSFEVRVRRVAEERVFRRKQDELRSMYSLEDQEDVNVGIQIYRQVKEWFIGEEGKTALAIEVPIVETLLDPVITKEHLFMNVNTLSFDR